MAKEFIFKGISVSIINNRVIILLLILIGCSSVTALANKPQRSISSDLSEVIEIRSKFPENVRRFLDWEVKANSADSGERGPAYFKLKSYIIPLEYLSLDEAAIIDPKIKAALIFEKNGKSFLRWPINPEDTIYHLKIKKFLASKGIIATIEEGFYGALTSSRSMIILDEKTGALFSGKVGTNKTGGKWHNKEVNNNQVIKARLATKIQEAVESRFDFKELIIQKETLGATIAEIDQGFIVRELGKDFVNGKNYYLPGFSALHNDVGVEIAKLNGYSNPVKFWKKAYLATLGAASADMFTFMGLLFDSPHSQQYLIELDQKLKPTGKIVFRDIADSNAFRPFFEKLKIPGTDFIMTSWLREFITEYPMVGSGTLHGMSAPDWIDKSDYREMNNEFFKAFDARFSRNTKISKRHLNHGEHFLNSGENNTHAYYVKDLTQVSHAQWRRYIEIAPCYQGAITLDDGRRCDELLSHLKNMMKSKRHSGKNCYNLFFSIFRN